MVIADVVTTYAAIAHVVITEGVIANVVITGAVITYGVVIAWPVQCPADLPLLRLVKGSSPVVRLERPQFIRPGWIRRGYRAMPSCGTVERRRRDRSDRLSLLLLSLLSPLYHRDRESTPPGVPKGTERPSGALSWLSRSGCGCR